MTVQEVFFPELLLRERSVSWHIVASTISPGQTGAGTFRLVRIDGGGVWMAELNEINLHTSQHVLCARALAASAENGVVPILLPMCEKRYCPAPIVGGRRVLSNDAIPHSDGAFFSDGTGYYQPVITAFSFVAASLRDTSLVIDITNGGALQGGEKFSIEHDGGGQGSGWRLYEIKTAALRDDSRWDVTFRPPLRGNVRGGMEIEFDSPRCVMRLADPTSLDIVLEQRRFGSQSPKFVEYFYEDS